MVVRIRTSKQPCICMEAEPTSELVYRRDRKDVAEWHNAVWTTAADPCRALIYTFLEYVVCLRRIEMLFSDKGRSLLKQVGVFLPMIPTLYEID